MSDAAAILTDLSNRAWAHAAVVAAVECGLLDDPTTTGEPVREAIADVLAALGLVEGVGADRRVRGQLADVLASPVGHTLVAELRSDSLQIPVMLDQARSGDLEGGWHHGDPELIDAQGETGRIFGVGAQLLLPTYGDVDQRLRQPGARFLDVGAGVAVISIELCKLYPEVHAVGLEPLSLAREIAECKIAAEGLSDRIELRDQLVENLDESEAYDLAFLPGFFIGDAFEEGLNRVLRALRPGGTIMALSLGATGDPLVDSIRRLRTAWWGGRLLDAEEVRQRLAEQGYVEPFVPPATGAYQPVLARRSRT